MKLFQGDTALVTGGASGIGRAISMALAREGARVMLSDLLAEDGRKVAAALGAEGADARFVASDLSDSRNAPTLVNQAIEAFGQITMLVHCASPRRHEEQTVTKVTSEEWDLMLNVNLKSGFELGRTAAVHMRDRAIKGRILYISSLNAGTPRNLPHYSAAKAGMIMVTKELARAFGPNQIRVNAIAPGAIAGGGFKAEASALTPFVPMGRLGKPEDVAGMAMALLCDRFSEYVTGTVVVVDGGIALSNWLPPRV